MTALFLFVVANLLQNCGNSGIITEIFVKEINMEKKQVVSRFAPSPTGYMHIGNLRTALYAYLVARASGGKFIVRIEDTDQNRYVAGAEEVIFDTLRTAGLDYDEGPDRDGGHGPYRQSERKSIYLEYANKLVREGKAYYCFCDKKEPHSDIFDADSQAEINTGDPCRELSEEQVAELLSQKKSFVIRHKVEKTGTTTYFDHVFGEISVENKNLHDIILIKSDGMPTYNFAHVIDDHLMGVTHVLRGNEYIISTPQYVQLHCDLGFALPEYYHLPLIMGKDAEGNVSKLSKRHGAVSFADLVSQGYLPEAIVNYIALLGWHPGDSDREIYSLKELTEVFSPDDIRKSAAIFDYDKLKWMNSQYILGMSLAEFREKAMPFIENTLTREVYDIDKLCEILQPRVQIFGEIDEKIEFFQCLDDFDITLLFNDKKKTNPQNAQQILETALEKLQKVELSDWHNDELFEQLSQVGVELELKPISVMWVIRVALSGRTVTVGGATEIMQILGKSETLIRLNSALARLKN